jgi:hypothetical protein
MKSLVRLLLLLLGSFSLEGCSLFSSLTNALGPVLGFVLALALIALPFVLSYYLYKGKL